MIHPRVLFIGDPAAAAPYVGIAKKLARQTFNARIRSKTYKLGDATIRVENTLPAKETFGEGYQQMFGGICKVWIQAGDDGFGFIVLPRVHENQWMGWQKLDGTVQERTVPVIYPRLYLNEKKLRYLPKIVDGNIVEENQPPVDLKSFFGVAYSKENKKPVTISQWPLLLAGNQFFYSYDKNTVIGRDVYSYWGSPAGDLPISAEYLYNEFSTFVKFVYGEYYLQAEYYILINEEVYKTYPMPANHLYKNGELLCTPGYGIIGGGVYVDDSIARVVVMTTNGNAIFITTSGEITQTVSHGILRDDYENSGVLDDIEVDGVRYPLYGENYNVSKYLNYYSGWEWKFSTDGHKASIIKFKDAGIDFDGNPFGSLVIVTVSISYNKTTELFSVDKESETSYVLSSTEIKYSPEPTVQGYGGTPPQYWAQEATNSGPSRVTGLVTDYIQSLSSAYFNVKNTVEIGYTGTYTGRIPVALNYVKNSLRVAWLEFDSDEEITGDRSDEKFVDIGEVVYTNEATINSPVDIWTAAVSLLQGGNRQSGVINQTKNSRIDLVIESCEGFGEKTIIIDRTKTVGSGETLYEFRGLGSSVSLVPALSKSGYSLQGVNLPSSTSYYWNEQVDREHEVGYVRYLCLASDSFFWTEGRWSSQDISHEVFNTYSTAVTDSFLEIINTVGPQKFMVKARIPTADEFSVGSYTFEGEETTVKSEGGVSWFWPPYPDNVFNKETPLPTVPFSIYRISYGSIWHRVDFRNTPLLYIYQEHANETYSGYAINIHELRSNLNGFEEKLSVSLVNENGPGIEVNQSLRLSPIGLF